MHKRAGYSSTYPNKLEKTAWLCIIIELSISALNITAQTAVSNVTLLSLFQILQPRTFDHLIKIDQLKQQLV